MPEAGLSQFENPASRKGIANCNTVRGGSGGGWRSRSVSAWPSRPIWPSRKPIPHANDREKAIFWFRSATLPPAIDAG